jgi:hypothetical protein
MKPITPHPKASERREIKRKILCFDNSQIDNEMSETAYYRLDNHFVEFLKKCEEKYTIVGFEYDLETPYNFGVLLGKRKIK